MAGDLGPQKIQRYPKNTALSTIDDSWLTIASYNLLAPLYVRPIDNRTGRIQPFAAFEWASDHSLSWEVRRPRIVAELRHAKPDLICLQEVQFGASASSASSSSSSLYYDLPDYLRAFAEEEGYGYRIAAQAELRNIADRNSRVLSKSEPIGNAVLYRRCRLEALDEQEEELEQGQAAAGESTKNKGNANTRVALCVAGRAGTALSVLGPTAVVSVHLDAGSEEQRVKQLRRALQHARSLSTGSRLASSSSRLALSGRANVVIAGDMNTECAPGSCIAAMLTPPHRSNSSSASSLGDLPHQLESSKEFMDRPSEAQFAKECASALRLGGSEVSEEKTECGQQSGSGEFKKRPLPPQMKAGVGPNASQMKSWRALWEAAATVPEDYGAHHLARAPTGCTRAASDHTNTTANGSSEPPPPSPTALSGGINGGTDDKAPALRIGQWRLDHIFYDAERGLECVAVWETLEADAAAAGAGLPCYLLTDEQAADDGGPLRVSDGIGEDSQIVPPAPTALDSGPWIGRRIVSWCPSDHLPVCAAFKPVPPPSLPDADRSALSERLSAIRAALQAKYREIAAEFEEEEKTLKAQQVQRETQPPAQPQTPAITPPPPPPPPNNNKVKKKTKQGKEKPSPEMILFLRRKREILKALAAQQREAWAATIAGLGRLEVEAAEDLGLFAAPALS